MLFELTGLCSVWKPLFGPLYDWPLAVCDYATVDPICDLVPSDNIYTHKTIETYNVLYNGNHKWYFLNGMRQNEVLVFKSFDSGTVNGLARGKGNFAQPQKINDPT